MFSPGHRRPLRALATPPAPDAPECPLGASDPHHADISTESVSFLSRVPLEIACYAGPGLCPSPPPRGGSS